MTHNELALVMATCSVAKEQYGPGHPSTVLALTGRQRSPFSMSTSHGVIGGKKCEEHSHNCSTSHKNTLGS